MQKRATRSKPLTRVFARTRAGARVRRALHAATTTCVHAITHGRTVLDHVFAEADHVEHSTCVEAEQLRREIGGRGARSELGAAPTSRTPDRFDRHLVGSFVDRVIDVLFGLRHQDTSDGFAFDLAVLLAHLRCS